MNQILGTVLGMWLTLTDPKRRNERGGSGSGTIETLLLIALAIAVVAAAGIGIKAYVSSHLP